MHYFIRKLLQLVVTLLVVTILAFVGLRAKGNAAELSLGPGASTEQLAEESERLGLDKPIPVQYVNWLGDLVTGDLGVSFAFNTRMTALIRERLPVSLVLMLYAQLLALAFAIPLGVWAAYRHDRLFDRMANAGAFLLLATPNLVLGVVLSLVFAARLKWFSAIGRDVGLFDDPVGHLKVYTLPSVTLAASLFAGYFRLLRADMVATLQQDFMVLARSKGMPTRTLLFRHALRPSSFSLITVAALQVGALVGGAFIVEYLFQMNGMAALTVEAILRSDYPVVQVSIVIFAVLFVVVNFAVDLLYGVLDPRVRHARALA